MTRQSDSEISWRIAALLLLPILAGCIREVEPREVTAAEQPAGKATATVLQTMDAGGYTYAELDVGGEPVWFAGSPAALAKGDTVVTPPRTMPMQDFRSESLDRTFDVIYFVQSFQKVGEGGEAASPSLEEIHESAMKQAHGAGDHAVDVSDIEKADGGVTVAELFDLGKEAAGREVVLRGKVVKFNANILGKNWLHVRDGTGAEGKNDITVTSGDTAAVGDTVLVRGTLAADRDLGMGYRFDLLIEDATVTVE